MKKQTITVDIEAYSQPCVLGNVSGGIHPGQMMVIAAGRRTGKSMYMKMLKNKIYGNNLCKEIFLPMYQEPKSKYQFSRAKWFTANFDYRKYDEVQAWCTDNFGPHPRHPDAWSRWVHTYEDQIFFRDSKDYEWFVLRWS